MKLLLTSAGFTNKTIIQGLKDLVEKPFEELKMAFIPTAANVELGDKGWLIEDLYRCSQLGLKQVDIVDISALPLDDAFSRLGEADLLFFGGGNTYHLMSWVEKINTNGRLLELIKSRVYIGLSAGSMIAGKRWSSKYDTEYYDEPAGPGKYDCLGIANLQIMPHLNSPYFPKVTLENMATFSKELDDTLFALDDNSAVKCIDDKFAVISEGVWKRFN